MLIFLPFAFLFGACVGSFLNVLIIRLPLDESIWRRNSHCTSCGNPIEVYDNIPILSYLILGGKCRKCGAKFSSQYFWVELITALCFALTFYFRCGDLVAPLAKGEYPSWEIIRLTVIPWLTDVSLISLLIAITWVDAIHMIIPLELSVSGFVIGLLLTTVICPELRGVSTIPSAMIEAGKAVAIGGGMLWSVRWAGTKVFKREAMGMGDVHLIIMLAMFLNWQAILLTIFLSAFTGSIGGTIAKLLQRKTHWRFEIPYGPYIAAGAIIAYFWGAGMIMWYLSFYQI